MSDVEQRIRERAYLIWIDRGRPEGHEKAHWEEARQALAHEAETPTLVPQHPVPPQTQTVQSPIDGGAVSTKTSKAKPKAFPPKRKPKAKAPAQTGVH